MTSITSYGQDFNRWALEAEIGGNRINDEASASKTGGLHLGLGLRYSFNEIVSAGLTVSFDTEELSNDFTYNSTDFKYFRANVEGYIDAFNILDLNNQFMTVLFHGGPGVSLIKTDNDYDQTLMNVRGGLTALFKFNERLAFKADFSTTANLNQSNSLDGFDANTNVGITSTLHNFSAGLVFYLDKKKERHADWSEKEEVADITNITNVTNPVTEITKEITIEKVCECNTEPVSEYVFFDHDEYVIRATELNAIYKAFASLDENADYRLDIRGFASPTSSSSEYNQTLSENRTNALKVKLVEMGLDESRITTSSYGKDLDRSNEVVYDIARRVELLIIRN